MQWGHIKTLFILAFLVLNIYLLYQFVDRQQDLDVSNLNNGEATISEALEVADITISADLSEETRASNYINVTQMTFSKEEIERLNSIPNLKASTVDGNFIVAQFESTLSLPSNVTDQTISALLAPYLLHPEDYEFYKWDEERNIIVFFQENGGRQVYFNSFALLLVYLNDKDEITHYTQTMVGNEEEKGSDAPLRTPEQVIETLYDRGELSDGSDISEVQLGYFSRFEVEGSHVFAPTWKVTIDGEKQYFVNAIEGLVHVGDDEEFFSETLELYRSKVMKLPEEDVLKRPALTILEQRIETENRSDTE